MTLEPFFPALEEQASTELDDFERRFRTTLPLTVTVALLAMSGHLLGLLAPRIQAWVELAPALPVVLWAGWPFFVRGARSVAARSPNMWTRISLGTGAAFIASVAATAAPGWFMACFSAMGRIGVYFEAAAVIISLALPGQLLELKTLADLAGDQVAARAGAADGALRNTDDANDGKCR